jgi:Vitamin K-dependent gamma-carboxylase
VAGEQEAIAACAPGGGDAPTVRRSGPAQVLGRLDAFGIAVTERKWSLYAAAALRIGYGLIYLAYLLREFPHRDEIWGPGSPMTPALARELLDRTGWFSVLTFSDSPVYFELCYGLALAGCVLFAIGWRTRMLSIVFAVAVTSFYARSVLMTDGGDNLITLMSLYLVCTDCGRRWSLDARRARRGSARRRPGLFARLRCARFGATGFARHLGVSRRVLVTVLHNCGMVVIGAQICILYATAGLYKVQGGDWDNGTALHYVLNLSLFRPWPALSAVADSHPMMITVAAYLTVLVQVAFPFALFGRLKYVVLSMLLCMHLGIAVLMGLPMFSGSMVVADAVFLSDRFYTAAGRQVRRFARRPAPAVPDAGLTGNPLVPAQEVRTAEALDRT